MAVKEIFGKNRKAKKEAIKIGINFNTVKLPNLFGSFEYH